MKSIISAFLAGLVFGLGLIFSEMVNPKRVRGFLDIFGNWDPTLIFVMGGALVATSIGYALIFRRDKPLFAQSYSVPTKKVIDHKLILGAILFGLGWGLSGFCPGPAIVGASTLGSGVLTFVAAMIVGMCVFEFTQQER